MAESSSKLADWPYPEPIPCQIQEVMRFNEKLLPDTFRPWVLDIAWSMQVPQDYAAIGIMVAFSGITGRRAGIYPTKRHDWLVIPNLWGGIVGKPGVMKTPVLDEAMKFVRGIEATEAERYQQISQEYQKAEMIRMERQKRLKKEIERALKKGTDPQEVFDQFPDDATDAPVAKRYLVNDVTVEKLGEIMASNPCGLLLYRDELVGFLKSLEKQGHETSRTFYLEAWNGNGCFTYDRIGRGTVRIPSVCISILGSIQPGPLRGYVQEAKRLGTQADGLLQRFQLLVWPDISEEWSLINQPVDFEAKKAVSECFERIARLDVIHPEKFESGFFHEQGGPRSIYYFEAEAQKEFNRWQESLERRLRTDSEHSAIEGHLAKFRSLVPSLALLDHLAEHSEGQVGNCSVEKAIGWAIYLESHARRIYASALTDGSPAIEALGAKLIQGELNDQFTARDIIRKNWSALTNKEEVESALNQLEELDWVQREKVATAKKPKTIFHINPKLSKK